MQILTVKAISVEELPDFNTFTIGMYDALEIPTQWIEIQKSLVFDAQDQELGMDTYCITLANGSTYYGGIDSCSLKENVLNICLSDQAAEELAIDAEVECLLQISDIAIMRLRSGLTRIFEEDPECPQSLDI